MHTPIKDKTQPLRLFEPGMSGSAAFRIPSLLTTEAGTVIAGADIRWTSMRDNPNHISIGVRRSEDNGKTWGHLQEIVRYPGAGEDGAAAIDSSLLQDTDTDTIWMLFSHTPGGIGLWQSEPGVGFDEEGRRLLFDERGKRYTLQPDGTVCDDDGTAMNYTVDEQGEVRLDGEARGNIYHRDTVEPRSLLEARTTFLQLVKSEDDGRTWSRPVELNPQVKQPWMKFLGGGPGRGLQLKRGDRRGRLVFPVYYSNPEGRMSNALVYSDDQGRTWKLGASPNDGRSWGQEKVTSRELTDAAGQLTESQVVELADGTLVFYIRNHSGKQRTAVAASRDGGESWGEVTFDPALVDPTCQSSVIAYPDDGSGRDVLIWSNPADPEHRRNGTVRMSEDGGRTWPYSRTVHEGVFWYSCLTVLTDGRIGLLYEGDEGFIYYTAFTREWIKNG